MYDDVPTGQQGRGKPPKSKETLLRMVIAHDPARGGSVSFQTPDAQAPFVEEAGLAAKFIRICRNIGQRLGNEVSEASGRADSDGDRETVRKAVSAVSKDGSYVNRFLSAERLRLENERVVSTLVRHLAEHLVIDGELSAIAASARLHVDAELREIPSTMVDFVNRLMACGVTTKYVQFMPAKRLARVVSAIMEMDEASALATVPEGLPECSWTDGSEGSSMVAENVDGDDVAGSGSASKVTPEEESNDGLNDGVGGGVEPVAERGAEPVGRMINRPLGGAIREPGVDLPRALDSQTMKENATDSEPLMIDAGDSAEVVPEAADAAEAGAVVDTGVGGVARVPVAVIDAPEGLALPRPEAGSATASVPAAEPASEAMSETALPPVEAPQLQLEPEVSVPSARLSIGPWVDLDITPTGYVVEEWTMADDADLSTRDLRLPPSTSMVEMSQPGTSERRTAAGATDQVDALLTRRFVIMYSTRMGLGLTEEEARLWVFLFHEARVENPSAFYGRTGWYDGVRMPPAPGSAKARRLVRVDRSQVSAAASPAVLARVAM